MLSSSGHRAKTCRSKPAPESLHRQDRSNKTIFISESHDRLAFNLQEANIEIRQPGSQNLTGKEKLCEQELKCRPMSEARNYESARLGD
jgi:hypothetical protein